MNTSSGNDRLRYWILWILAAVFVAAAAPAFAADCDRTAPREAVVDAAGATLLEIEAAAGSLAVVGREGLSEVRATGEACASNESLLDQVRLVASRRGDRIVLVAEMPESLWGSSTARLDLRVEVPTKLAVRIDDGSGSIELRGVASAEIDDGSGDIHVEDVGGDVRIDDGSGDIAVTRVNGQVHVEDGSGGIDVTIVAGQVRIEDGSGEIRVRRAGSVVIEEDGSGSIDVAEVEGRVLVREDGSGSISVRDVGGDLIVHDDGSGGIRHENVAGAVDLPEED
ncbi:MAG: DUF4097 domain-containing protein [Acidobacteriota bacterium]|nr:DUF4097 domain-containing protein [Acidobacteriota bacterium]